MRELRPAAGSCGDRDGSRVASNVGTWTLLPSSACVQAHGNIDVNVEIFAPEIGVRLHARNDETDLTGSPPVCSPRPFEADSAALLDAGRDFHFDRLRLSGAPRDLESGRVVPRAGLGESDGEGDFVLDVLSARRGPAPRPRPRPPGGVRPLRRRTLRTGRRNLRRAGWGRSPRPGRPGEARQVVRPPPPRPACARRNAS
jgi:hypothetical protein